MVISSLSLGCIDLLIPTIPYPRKAHNARARPGKNSRQRCLAVRGVQVDGPAKCLQRGQLLESSCTAGGQEQVRELEVAPVRRAEARGDDHVRELGVARGRVELAEVHDLEQRVEHVL